MSTASTAIDKYKFSNYLELDPDPNQIKKVSTISVTSRYIAIGFANSEIQLFSYEGYLANGNIFKLNVRNSKSSSNQRHEREPSPLPVLDIDISNDGTWICAVTENMAALFDVGSDPQRRNNKNYVYPCLTVSTMEASLTDANCCLFAPEDPKNLQKGSSLGVGEQAEYFPTIIIGANKLIQANKETSILSSLGRKPTLATQILDNLGQTGSNPSMQNQQQQHIQTMAFHENKKYLAYATNNQVKVVQYLPKFKTGHKFDNLRNLGNHQKPGYLKKANQKMSNLINYNEVSKNFCQFRWKGHLLFTGWDNYVLFGKLQMEKVKRSNVKNKNVSDSMMPRANYLLPTSADKSSIGKSAAKITYVAIQSFKLDESNLLRGLVIQLKSPKNERNKMHNSTSMNLNSSSQKLNQTNSIENQINNSTNDNRAFDQISIADSDASLMTMNTEMTGYTMNSSICSQTRNSTNGKSGKKLDRLGLSKYGKIEITALVNDEKDKTLKLDFLEVDCQNLLSNQFSDYKKNSENISKFWNQTEDFSLITLYESIEDKLFICNQSIIQQLHPLTITDQVNALIEKNSFEQAFTLAESVETFTVSSDDITKNNKKKFKNKFSNYVNSKKVEKSVLVKSVEKYVVHLAKSTLQRFIEKTKNDENDREKSPSAIDLLSTSMTQMTISQENKFDIDFEHFRVLDQIPDILKRYEIGFEPRKTIWNKIFESYFAEGKAYFLMTRMPVFEDAIILEEKAKNKNLNDEPIFSKKDYERIAIQALQEVGINVFQELIYNELIPENAPCPGRPSRNHYQSSWLNGQVLNLNILISEITNLSIDHLFLAELYMKINQPAAAFMIYLKNKCVEKIWSKNLVEHELFCKNEIILPNLKKLIDVDCRKITDFLVENVSDFDPNKVYTLTEDFIDQDGGENCEGNDDMAVFHEFSSVSHRKPTIYSTFLTNYFLRLENYNSYSDSVLLNKAIILASYSPKNLFDYLKNIQNLLKNCVKYSGSRMQGDLGHGIYTDIFVHLDTQGRLNFSENKKIETESMLSQNLSNSQSKISQKEIDFLPTFTTERVWLLGLDYSCRAQALEILLTEEENLDSAVNFCHEWHKQDQPNSSDQNRKINIQTLHNKTLALDFNILFKNSTNKNDNIWLQKLIDLASNGNFPPKILVKLLSALIRCNGFDFYTLSVLKQLSDDHKLTSKEIQVIVEQKNFQHLMVEHLQAVENSQALRCVIGGII